MTEETNRGNAYCRPPPAPHPWPVRPTNPAHDVFNDDDAIVDQQAEGDDDRGDRYLLERDAERAHADDCKHDGKGNNHRRDQPGPQPKKDDDEAADDDEGLRDI